MTCGSEGRGGCHPLHPRLRSRFRWWPPGTPPLEPRLEPGYSTQGPAAWGSTGVRKSLSPPTVEKNGEQGIGSSARACLLTLRRADCQRLVDHDTDTAEVPRPLARRVRVRKAMVTASSPRPRCSHFGDHDRLRGAAGPPRPLVVIPRHHSGPSKTGCAGVEWGVEAGRPRRNRREPIFAGACISESKQDRVGFARFLQAFPPLSWEPGVRRRRILMNRKDTL